MPAPPPPPPDLTPSFSAPPPHTTTTTNPLLQVILEPLQSAGSHVPGLWPAQYGVADAPDPTYAGYPSYVECPLEARAPIQATSYTQTASQSRAQRLEGIRRAIIKAFASHVYGLDDFGNYLHKLEVRHARPLACACACTHVLVPDGCPREVGRHAACSQSPLPCGGPSPSAAAAVTLSLLLLLLKNTINATSPFLCCRSTTLITTRVC